MRVVLELPLQLLVLVLEHEPLGLHYGHQAAPGPPPRRSSHNLGQLGATPRRNGREGNSSQASGPVGLLERSARRLRLGGRRKLDKGEPFRALLLGRKPRQADVYNRPKLGNFFLDLVVRRIVLQTFL